jgi:hypothetical protein
LSKKRQITEQLWLQRDYKGLFAAELFLCNIVEKRKLYVIVIVINGRSAEIDLLTDQISVFLSLFFCLLVVLETGKCNDLSMLSSLICK